MTDSRDDDEFAATAEELSTVLQELRDELKREQPRGPFGLPRPPSPSEVLRFADEVAIPGTIAVLEVNIKLLETVQRAIRIVDTGSRARDRAGDARGRASESASRLADVSDRTLRGLEDSLSDLQSALDDGGLPEDGAAGELLSEARALREDVQSRLREARERDHTLDDFEERANRADEDRRANAARDDDPANRAGDRSSGASSGRDGSGDRGVKVDVDAELETLRDRYGKRDDAEPTTETDSDDAGAGGADATEGSHGDADDDDAAGDSADYDDAASDGEVDGDGDVDGEGDVDGDSDDDANA